MQEEKKYLGVDWGKKRIGLAMADSITRIAIPVDVVGSFNELIQFVKKEEIDLIVLGLPIRMSGQDDELLVEYRNFAKKLEKQSSVPIELIDERLSSLAADALSGNKKVKAQRDALAAMIILQSFLDRTK